nr:zinc finger CCCH domain-containing protein 22-like isoform X1 [Ipomoea batatas]
MFNNSQEALLRRKLEKEAVLQKAIDLHSSLMDLQLMDVKNKEKATLSHQTKVTEENSSHKASSAGQENKSGSEDSGKKQRCNNPELHKRALELRRRAVVISRVKMEGDIYSEIETPG